MNEEKNTDTELFELHPDIAEKFKDLHPEYYATEENGQTLLRFASSQIPKGQAISLENLEFAFEKMAPVLEKRPSPYRERKAAEQASEEARIAAEAKAQRIADARARTLAEAAERKENHDMPFEELRQKAIDQRRANCSESDLKDIDHGLRQY